VQAGIARELRTMERLDDEVMAQAESLRIPPDRQGFLLRRW
jgi:hypothetical protein